jgi:tRNA(Ile)-lysidine synthase
MPARHPVHIVSASSEKSSANPVANPVTARAFATAMTALGPFEPRPHLALAVSGGADSMALALLAARWAAARGGRLTALTVDHRLRSAAATEARQVRCWLAAAGIAHRTLVWRHERTGDSRALQARARAARYGLLEHWCARNAVLHLLTAHHQGDQAETFLMRLAAQSGPRGLTAMSPVRELTQARLLRPLLGFTRASLESTLRVQGQDWIEDPSNRDAAFARVRLRALVPELEAAGLSRPDMAALAARFAGIRRNLEARLARRLAQAARPHPAGFVRLDRTALCAGVATEGEQALARVLGAVSGASFAPRRERLTRLFAALADPEFSGATLGGCRILPDGPGGLLVCRELSAQADPITARAGDLIWDGRFFLRLRGQGRGRRVGALGTAGWREIARRSPELVTAVRARAIPVPVRASLPALFGRSGPVQVPHIGYGPASAAAATLRITEVRPLVAEPLAGPRVPAPGLQVF